MTDDNDVSGDLASRLANSIGDALGAEPGRTWVRLRTLPHHRYAESGPTSFDGVSPVFVTIKARRHPNPNDFAVVAPRVCAAAAANVRRSSGKHPCDLRGRRLWTSRVRRDAGRRIAPESSDQLRRSPWCVRRLVMSGLDDHSKRLHDLGGLRLGVCADHERSRSEGGALLCALSRTSRSPRFGVRRVNRTRARMVLRP